MTVVSIKINSVKRNLLFMHIPKTGGPFCLNLADKHGWRPWRAREGFHRKITTKTKKWAYCGGNLRIDGVTRWRELRYSSAGIRPRPRR